MFMFMIHECKVVQMFMNHVTISYICLLLLPSPWLYRLVAAFFHPPVAWFIYQQTSLVPLLF